jgi:hypothetical protein
MTEVSDMTLPVVNMYLTHNILTLLHFRLVRDPLLQWPFVISFGDMRHEFRMSVVSDMTVVYVVTTKKFSCSKGLGVKSNHWRIAFRNLIGDRRHELAFRNLIGDRRHEFRMTEVSDMTLPVVNMYLTHNILTLLHFRLVRDPLLHFRLVRDLQ